MVRSFVPDRGDIVLLHFTPQAGKEQAGIRPALVLSPKAYNEKVGLMLACPITTKQKGYPFEIALLSSQKTKGVVLADHIRSLDWRARRVRKLEHAAKQTVDEALKKLGLLLEY